MSRQSDALREARVAAELDPFAVVATSNYAWQCYQSRDYDCALDQYRRSQEINATWPSAYRGQALVYTQQGTHEKALRAARKAVELAPERPDFLADLAFVQARAGQTDAAHETLRQSKMRPFEPFNVARAHVALGETDSAFVWLERSNWRWPHRAPRSDPGLDPLRTNVLFKRLSERIDLEMGMIQQSRKMLRR
jgi:tetratricopeptide (TPR) repeat protein